MLTRRGHPVLSLLNGLDSEAVASEAPSGSDPRSEEYQDGLHLDARARLVQMGGDFLDPWSRTKTNAGLVIVDDYLLSTCS